MVNFKKFIRYFITNEVLNFIFFNDSLYILLDVRIIFTYNIHVTILCILYL